MIGWGRGWFATGLIISIISILVSVVADGAISSLIFLPVLIIFIGLPIVHFIRNIRTIPNWRIIPISFLIGLIVTATILSLNIIISSSSDHVITVASSISAVLNGIQLILLRNVRSAKLKYFDKKTTVAASIFITLLILVAFTIVQPFPSKPLTEFYILNEDGKTTDMPYHTSTGGVVNLTVGIANHETRTIEYHVQVWLAEMGDRTDPNSTRTMYYLDNHSVTLNHTPISLSGEWLSQYEFDYNVEIPTGVSGSLRLWFFLFADEVPVEYDDLELLTNHYDEGLSLIEKAHEREILSLSILLHADKGA